MRIDGCRIIGGNKKPAEAGFSQGLFIGALQRNPVRYSSIRLNRLRTGGFGSCSTFSTGAAGFGVAGAAGFSATTGAAAGGVTTGAGVVLAAAGTFGFGSTGGLVSALAADATAGVGTAAFGFGGAFGFTGALGFGAIAAGTVVAT